MASEEAPALIDMFIFDELLECVFNYLTIIELIKIERVSKRWQRISMQSWRSRRKIKFGKDLGYKFPLDHMKSILQRCGNYLIHLDLLGIISFFPSLNESGGLCFVRNPIPEEDIFSAISQYCKQLVSLKVFVDDSHGKNLRFLNNSVFTNLKVFSVHYGRTFGSNTAENRLSLIIKKAVKLEEFEVQSQHNIDGSCLLNLPITCKKLSFSHTYDIDDDIIEKVIKRLPNLKELYMNTTYLEPRCISTVSDQLLSLDVGGCEEFFKDRRYKVLSFENLQELNIKWNKDIDDIAFRFLIDSCPLLQKLNATDLENVSDNAFRHLGKLKNLKSLNLSENEQITDSTLIFVAQSLNSLVEFECEDCEQISCSGLLSLINSCKDLRYLQIEGLNVTDAFFGSALKSVDKRPKYVSLTIHVASGTAKGLKCLKPDIDRPLKYNYCKVLEEDLNEDLWSVTRRNFWFIDSSTIPEN